MSKRIVFMGTPDFAAVVLRHLVDAGYDVVACVSQPDKPVGRKMVMTPPPAKLTAIECSIPVWQPSSLRNEEALATMRAFAPDIIITAAYGKILPADMLAIPTIGCLNVHASLLPKYRGSAPVHWAILNGDEKTGVTLMDMDVGMDTGDVYSMIECPIHEDSHTESLMHELALLGSTLLLEKLPLYIAGTLEKTKQDEALVTLAPPITKEMGIIDWTLDARLVNRKIHALSTWPGASTQWNGTRIKIYDAQVAPNAKEILQQYEEQVAAAPKPGTILVAKKGVLAVMCNDLPICLLELQPQSGKRMLAKDCAHNYVVGSLMEESSDA
ncbi:MAG TPA: methionyl-tRNA formyltransferase [Bacillota bacterium]|nr:methionyl-tRNA formyltransferase [Bacillota bacterium]HPE38742.1 methionyl-tRNA formyltransferase [Bacillota bacterium]